MSAGNVLLFILRWIAFLPVGLLLAAILQFIPPFVIQFLSINKVGDMSLMQLLIAIVIVLFAMGLIPLWHYGVALVPMLCARVIAPNRKIAAIILGTLVLSVQLWAMFTCWISKEWAYLAFNGWFAVWFLGGTIGAYADDE